MVWRMPTLAVNAAHTAEENCGPLSEVRMAGTPKRVTQPAMSAAAQSSAAVDLRGMASHHRVALSMTVKRCVY
jgi:hypothetical protein